MAGGMILLIIAMTAPLVRSLVVARRLVRRFQTQGLSNDEARHLLDTPTFGTDFWEKPAVRAVLHSSQTGRAPDVTAQRADRIRAVLEELGFRESEVHQELVQAAESALESLDSLDQEIAAITRDGEERESTRSVRLAEARMLREKLQDDLDSVYKKITAPDAARLM